MPVTSLAVNKPSSASVGNSPPLSQVLAPARAKPDDRTNGWGYGAVYLYDGGRLAQILQRKVRACAYVQMTIRAIHPFNEGRTDHPGSWRSRQRCCQSLLRAIDTARLDLHDASLPAGLVHDGIDQVGGLGLLFSPQTPTSRQIGARGPFKSRILFRCSTLIQYAYVDGSAQLPISRAALSRVFIICKPGAEPTSHTLEKLALSCLKRVYSFTFRSDRLTGCAGNRVERGYDL